jgi:hypothetical protein
MEKINIQKIKDLILENIEEAMVLKKQTDKDRIATVSDNPVAHKATAESMRHKETLKKNGFTFAGDIKAWVIPADKIEHASKIINMINKTDDMIHKLEDLEEMITASNADPSTQDTIKAKINMFINDLANAVDERAADAQLQDFFKFFAKFTAKSPRNQLLIYLQNPKATKVAGYSDWQKKFHRQVVKGAKGIGILAPIKYKTNGTNSTNVEDIEDKDLVAGFKVVYVYDIADTTAINPKGEIPETPKWWGDNTPSETADELFEYTKELATNIGIKVTTLDAKGGEKGYSAGDHINLTSNISGVGRLSTMIHEMAHELMHWKKTSPFYDEANIENNRSSQLLELQAESVSFIVLKHYGLDVKHHATYLALWRANKERIIKNIEIIGKVSHFLIEKIDEIAQKYQEEHTEEITGTINEAGGRPGEPDKIGISLFSLVKNNAGLFKSEKQAKFLLSQVNNGETSDGKYSHHMGGNVYGNSYSFFFTLDEKGVVKVEKTQNKTHKSSVYFERPSSDGEVASLQGKHEARRTVRDILMKYTKEFYAKQEEYDKRIKQGEEESSALLAQLMKVLSNPESDEYKRIVQELTLKQEEVKQIEDTSLTEREAYHNGTFKDELLKKYNLTPEDIR